MNKFKYNKVIIWGYPMRWEYPYAHTHSYVHHSYHKAFSYLGYNVHWFDDENYPKDFDFSNSLFIGEGFADKNIPINNTSCYMIMYCPSPEKYKIAERFIDVRTAGNCTDHIHDYKMDLNSVIKIGPGCYFEPKTSQKTHVKNDYVDYLIDDYDRVYISWATNLLPHEINFDDIYINREPVIHYLGTISPAGKYQNYTNFVPFLKACSDNGIRFIHNDPWHNPLSFEDVKIRTQKSLLGIDIRGPEHISQRVITCRIFKNISYGHLGLTNSEGMYEIMDGNCIYNTNTEELFYDGMKNKDNYKLIYDGMMFVKENHTYINRINSLLSIL